MLGVEQKIIEGVSLEPDGLRRCSSRMCARPSRGRAACSQAPAAWSR